MLILFHTAEIIAREPLAILYFAQAVTYALAFWAVRCGRHAPCQVYLANCLVYAALGVLHLCSQSLVDAPSNVDFVTVETKCVPQ